MKIVTDSAADLLPEEVSNLDITVAPLSIQFPEGEVVSDQLTPDEFYARLQAMEPEIPTTTLPSPGIFADIYRKVAQAKEEILSIHISSGLSGTFESARLGAKDAEMDVTLINSLTLSGGQRFQVLAAAMAASAGHNKEAILKRLEQIRNSTEVIYTLETLKYLQRGGRIGRVQALAGSLLKIKPVIKVEKEDGKYSTVTTGRTIRQSLMAMVEYLQKAYPPETPLWLSVLHGQFAEGAENLTQLLREKLNVAKLETLRISPVLGVHTGPGIVGVTAVPISMFQDLS